MIKKTYKYIKWGSEYNIDISYDKETNIIEVNSSSNSFRCKFNADSLEEFISFLNYAKDYEQYDDDSDEYYNPDDLELDSWFAECSGYEIKHYSGNWVEVYQIPSIIASVQDFASCFCFDGITKNDVKSMNKEDLNKYTVTKLKYLLKMIQDKPSKTSV